MKILKSYISLNKVRLYGFHGVPASEKAVGSWFEIDLTIGVDLGDSALRDDKLEGTVDYSRVLAEVKDEFKHVANLIEHLAYNIAGRVFAISPTINSVHITVKKIAPPMSGNVGSSAVDFEFTRS